MSILSTSSLTNHRKLFSGQKPPKGDWDVWLVEGSRGSGRSTAALEYVIEHLYNYEHEASVGIVVSGHTQQTEILRSLRQLDPKMFPDMMNGLRLTTVFDGHVYSFEAHDTRRMLGIDLNLLWLENADLWYNSLNSDAGSSGVADLLMQVRRIRERSAKTIITVFKPQWQIDLEKLPGTVKTQTSVIPGVSNGRRF